MIGEVAKIHALSDDAKVFCAQAAGVSLVRVAGGNWQARTPGGYTTCVYGQKHDAAYWALRAMLQEWGRKDCEGRHFG